MKTLKNADILAGTGLCIFSVAVFFSAQKYHGQGASAYGPHLFPQFLSVSLFLASVLLLIQAFRGKSLEAQDTIDPRGMVRAGGAILTCVLYIIIMQFIGFLIATILFLFIMMTYIKQKNIYTRVAASIAVALIVLLLFQYFLKIPLPSMDFSWSY
jgi:hypothetical protein